MGLAAGLKVGAEHVYQVLVKQQIVKSIIWLLIAIISGFFVGNWFKAYKNKTEEWTDNYEDVTFIGVVRGLQICLGLVLLVASIINIDVIVTGLINPEYGAIKEIINFVK